MTGKSEIEVIIGGKVYYISGYESEEYLQKVASYINSKISDFEGEDAYKRLNGQYQNLLLLLNLADDYFKAKNRIELLEEEVHSKDDDLCNIKHELIATQIKLDNAKSELSRSEITIANLEGQLKNRE
ncbi:MAG: cell division protein ZapA [Lachnospiraceae bacterium]|jgi:cell division protein ZapA|nr:cell division protein ZapA [Lachnospiraceae bacterium]MBP5276037.1 cell division protein ZapA [Lachnospiraceae bacterium]MBP5564555.1 cell division protein ZapA [Lachnospiraceae bacterium]MBQ4276008.1 cell division protein ZapA [Lachnospiraceae bacterium]MCR4696607.1 cell division protein ZapA [Lachnospiraceae bacterium]